jgi:hypothetical protein
LGRQQPGLTGRCKLEACRENPARALNIWYLDTVRALQEYTGAIPTANHDFVDDDA